MSEDREIVQVPTQDVEVVDSTQYILQMAERRAGLIDKVKELGIKATNAGDWVDQNGTPYLVGSGAEKIRTRFALKIWDTRVEKFNISDTNGDYYYFRVSGKVGFNAQESIDVIGTCSSRDQFFAKKNGQLIPTADVDITNIEKSAYTNFLVNGISRFLGLRNMTWEEIEKFGIKRGQVSRVDYAKGKKSSQWDDEQRKKALRLGNFLLASADGNKELAQKTLEEMTTWKNEKGEAVKGKKSINDLSGKQVDLYFGKLEKEIKVYENAGQESEAGNGNATE